MGSAEAGPHTEAAHTKYISVSFLIDASVCLYSLGIVKLRYCLLKSLTSSLALEPILGKKIYKPLVKLEQSTFLFLCLAVSASSTFLFLATLKKIDLSLAVF